MRITRALAASAAAVAALGLAAPMAAAWDDPTMVTAQPSVISRGGQLVLTVHGEACQMQGSTVSSDAFPTTKLMSMGGSTATAGATSTARVTVNTNARTGAHSVTTHCEGRSKTFQNVFTVVGGIQGGVGGSSSFGATPTDIAIGGGLVAAALTGGGLFWMRRRSESRI